MKNRLSLPDEVASIQDLTVLILEVREYVKWFSHNAILERVSKKRTVKPIALSPSATKLLQNWEKLQPLTTRSLDELLDTLNLYKNTAPTLSITLAAPVTNDIKQTLINWCRANVAPNVMVTFGFNATLLGGMVVHHGSRIFDWSFRRQILAARENFAEVLRRV
ncbi:MAG: atpH [Candidatus Saccharibacteria bacterium]|nr:atpH [Candidatus Saccharibacteria bacterium]